MFHLTLNLLLQASLFSLAFASETVSTSSHGNSWKFGTGGGIIGFIILILDIIVFGMNDHVYLSVTLGDDG